MTPLEIRLTLMGADIVSDILMDIYFDMKGKGKESITAEEILAMANRWQLLRSTEIQKIKDRMNQDSA